MTPRQAPRLFDRAAGRRALDRARRQGFADFLLRRAAEDLDQRLSAVMRDFLTIGEIGTPLPLFHDVLAGRYPAASILRLAPLPECSQGSMTAVGDAGTLPLAEGRFDLVVSGFALHQLDDLPGALIQMRRALKPDGLLIACLPGGETLRELREALARAESDVSGGMSPRVQPSIDIRDAGALLQRAGLALPVVDLERVVVRYASPLNLMHDLRAMGAVNTLAERSRTPLRREVLRRACAIYVERFAEKDGRVPATFDLVWLSGWAPHESQQKPLKPGSARTSLAEALKATR